MTTPLTDERLAEIEALLTPVQGNAWDWYSHGKKKLEAFPDLLAEVRRLREKCGESAPEGKDVPNLWISVSGQNFTCSCGCKLFHQHNRHIPDYHCNACGAVYEGM